MWLQEQNVAAGVKMWLQDKLLKSSFSVICCDFIFFQIHGLSEPHYLVLFLLGANLDFSEPWCVMQPTMSTLSLVILVPSTTSTSQLPSDQFREDLYSTQELSYSDSYSLTD